MYSAAIGTDTVQSIRMQHKMNERYAYIEMCDGFEQDAGMLIYPHQGDSG